MEKIFIYSASQSVSKIISIKVANKSNRIILTAQPQNYNLMDIKKSIKMKKQIM